MKLKVSNKASKEIRRSIAARKRYQRKTKHTSAGDYSSSQSDQRFANCLEADIRRALGCNQDFAQRIESMRFCFQRLNFEGLQLRASLMLIDLMELRTIVAEIMEKSGRLSDRIYRSKP